MNPVVSAYLGDSRLFAHDLANAIPPILLVLIAQEPLLHATNPWRQTARFWIACALAIGVASMLAQVGKGIPIWPNHPGFPSGHMSFTSAAIVCLRAWRGPRWLPLLLILGALMAITLFQSRAHEPLEIAGGAVLGTTIAFVVLRIVREKIPT